jgi:hypothetical protein
MFRREFEGATGQLTTWAEHQRDAADVEFERSHDFWRLKLTPHVANACLIELILHRATQSYDLQIGSESWEGLRITALDAFQPILEAIVAGFVVTRSFHAVSSHALLRVETTIESSRGAAVCLDRTTVMGQRLCGPEMIIRDRHWLPYRRAVSAGV